MRQSRTSGSEGGRDEQSPGLPDPTRDRQLSVFCFSR